MAGALGGLIDAYVDSDDDEPVAQGDCHLSGHATRTLDLLQFFKGVAAGSHGF